MELPAVLLLFLQPVMGQQTFTFQLANTSHFEEVHKLLEEEFFPEEPLSRSCGSNQTAYYWTWWWVEENLRKFSTVVALDQNGSIVGVNLGYDNNIEDDDYKVDEEDSFWSDIWCAGCTSMWDYQAHLMWKMKTLLGSLTPIYYGDNPVWAVYYKAVHLLGYDKSVEELKNQNCTKLYNLEFLSVKRSARRRGLGMELTRVGEEEAMSRGCGCGRVFASSRYSARIFTKLGWTETGRLRYEDLVSDEGEMMIRDSGEHEMMVTFSKIFSV